MATEPRAVRASLEVGFGPGESVPEPFAACRGRDARAIAALSEFPYEDAQFEVVIMSASAVSRAAVKEAHRVLRPDGRLLFRVPERTKKQVGFTLPEIYSLVREGFNITSAVRPPWWWFGRHGRTLTICAGKKTWRPHTNTYRPYL